MRKINPISTLFGILAILALGTSACQKQQTEGLPDLIVKDISCMGEGLYITVANQGEGSIEEIFPSLASFSVDGEFVEDIILSEPTSTSGGGISEPGGESRYLIAYPISTAVRVAVHVDYNDEIQESDEVNNSAPDALIGPCVLPDLAVEKIELADDNHVVVTIRNLGPGPVPEHIWLMDEATDCTLRIIHNDSEWCHRSFIDFDPDRALQPLSGIGVFHSDLVITEESSVTAIIDCTDMIMEQNEANNSMTVTLVPSRVS
jgi:hypothetical protein